MLAINVMISVHRSMWRFIWLHNNESVRIYTMKTHFIQSTNL